MEIILKDQHENEIDIFGYKKKKVIFFYPKANTPGCTKEVKEFGEHYDEFKELGIEVFGVSADSLQKQKNFACKLETPISLLSDPERKLIEHFGVWQLKKTFGKEYMGIVRSTFILDKDNNIVESLENVKVGGHVEKVLELCEKL